MRVGQRPSQLPTVGQLTLAERTAACSSLDLLSARVGGGSERRPEALQLQLRPKPASLRTVPPLPKGGRSFLGRAPPSSSPAGERGVLPRWPKLGLRMLLPTPTSHPGARSVPSPPAPRRRLGSAACTPPPPRAANQRWILRPGPASAPPRLGASAICSYACPGAWGWARGGGGMSRGFGHAHRDRKAVWHGPGRLTLSTHSPARQPRPWETSPDRPTSP